MVAIAGTFGIPRILPTGAQRLLALNRLPHPHWMDAGPNALTLLSREGAVFVVVAVGARVFGLPRSERALWTLLPSVFGTGLLVRYVLKRAFQRPRPLTARVRALVLGQHLRSSLPSGDATTSFAGAWALSTVWPQWAPFFLGLATALGFTRVHVGAHRPDEVVAGAVLSVVLAEIVRRIAGQTRAERHDSP